MWLLHWLAELCALPGILADSEKLSVHGKRIMGVRIFEIKPSLVCRIGETAGIGQDILAPDYQIHMELIRVPVPCAHGPAMEMKQIGITLPSAAQIIVAGILQCG